ncbi:MAG: hypothetical protein PHW24_02680 [Candidatus Moranbacteria bacterium]|nr:hypothetical protein [Candidatus Moranbacteria bacterium]
MPKIIMTMAKFTSFEEIAEALGRWGEKVTIPENPQPGIHVVTIFDDGQYSTIQHALAVVIGDFDKQLEVRDVNHGEGVLGSDSEIITIAFEKGDIPLLVDGEDTNGKIDTHSLYSPRCRCIRTEE